MKEAGDGRRGGGRDREKDLTIKLLGFEHGIILALGCSSNGVKKVRGWDGLGRQAVAGHSPAALLTCVCNQRTEHSFTKFCGDFLSE